MFKVNNKITERLHFFHSYRNQTIDLYCTDWFYVSWLSDVFLLLLLLTLDTFFLSLFRMQLTNQLARNCKKASEKKCEMEILNNPLLFFLITYEFQIIVCLYVCIYIYIYIIYIYIYIYIHIYMYILYVYM